MSITRRAGWLIALTALAARAGADAPEAKAKAFLRGVIHLDEAQLAAIERGEVVTKQLATSDKTEIAAFGAVKTAGNPDLLLRLARDVRAFRKSAQVSEIGVFSRPPRLSDLDGLTHPPDDIAALRKCRPGSCDVKLGTKGLEVVSKIDWAAPDAQQRAVATFNQGIIDYAVAYARGGTSELGDVLDKKQARSRSDEYRALLANSPYLIEYVKDFHDYLASYPAGTLAGVEDVLYWTKDSFGPKPVVSGYHLTLYRSPAGILIANKLLAATHFFNAALEIVAGVPTSDGSGMYLLCLYRTRIDPPTGMLAGALMDKVRGGMESGVRANLKTARERLAAAK
jgi:hypothetical protein